QRDVVVEAHDPWPDGVRVVTKREPSRAEWEALRFAWRICAHVKSNAVIFTDAQRTLAIGAGQMSRVDAVNVAVMKAQAGGQALTGSAAASDAFFPFRDGLDAIASAGASVATTVSPAPVTSDTSRATAGIDPSTSVAPSHIPCSPRVISSASHRTRARRSRAAAQAASSV